MTNETGRPSIPRELRRRVLVEAGHRCAIPTCRTTTTEIAHIVPWATCRTHEFENLIALCPTCHTRYDAGEIDRKSMRIYKANLALLTSRYSDFERRILDELAQKPGETAVRLPAGYRSLLAYLIRDGLLTEPEVDKSIGHAYSANILMMGIEQYELTAAGREFLASYASARSLSPDDEDE